MGMDIGRIPWTAIDRYGHRHGFTGERFTFLARLVMACDDEWHSLLRKKRKHDKAEEDREAERSKGKR